MVQPGQGQPSKGQSSQRKSRSEQSRQPRRLQSRPTQWGKIKNYRDLLNSVITDAAARNPGLSDEGLTTSSQIGASLWTSQEKDCLFRRMCLTGRHDLPFLHRAVPSKSEAEINVYLQLLEEGRKLSTFDAIDMPAAAEVSEECVRALEASANSISTQINDRDKALQQAEFGENWLIDMESAYYIDLAYDQSSEEDQEKLEEGSEYEDAKASVSENLPLIAESDASISLLRPSSFLELSRTLFMNSSEYPDHNWQRADFIEESVTGPAIFRGAFEDLHNIVVSLTRRLVQVSLFQAMTRLRAGDSSRHDWSPAPLVREVDVHSALDVLNIKANAREYWATAARRCKVHVLTESKKYLDGRQGTRNGVELTYDEVEAELGLDYKNAEIIKNDSREFKTDSDMYTETETDEDENSEEDIDDKTSRSRSRSISRKRKRALSPSTHLRSESKYLNAVDRNASVNEEDRLWKVLRMQPPAHLSLHQVKTPDHPGQEKVLVDDWKGALRFEAEWEHPYGCVEHEQFLEMGFIGTQVRRQREKVQNRWWARGKVGEEDEVEDAKMEVSEVNEQETDDGVDSDHKMTDQASEEEAEDNNDED